MNSNDPSGAATNQKSTAEETAGQTTKTARREVRQFAAKAESKESAETERQKADEIVQAPYGNPDVVA